MIETLQNQKNLNIKEALVEHLVVENNKIKGIITNKKEVIESKIVILTTGTYLKSKILIGNTSKEEGPHGETTQKSLSQDLKKLGFTIQRLKTGTPPRIQKDSIDYTKTTIEPGSKEPFTFSFNNKVQYDPKNQENCYLIYTTKKLMKL